MSQSYKAEFKAQVIYEVLETQNATVVVRRPSIKVQYGATAVSGSVPGHWEQSRGASLFEEPSAENPHSGVLWGWGTC